MFLCTQKSQKATFFILDVFMRTKTAKSTRRKALLLLRRFMRTKMLSFLFAYVRFVLFMPFSVLDVFMYVFFLFLLMCAFCACAKLSFLFVYVLFMIFMPNKQLFPLRRFYARLRLFLFSFAYVFFMLVRSFLKRYKTP